jgi:hypothetical protein
MTQGNFSSENTEPRDEDRLCRPSITEEGVAVEFFLPQLTEQENVQRAETSPILSEKAAEKERSESQCNGLGSGRQFGDKHQCESDGACAEQDHMCVDDDYGKTTETSVRRLNPVGASLFRQF